MREEFFEIEKNKDAKEGSLRAGFENFIDELGINSMELTSLYARKLSKMEPLEDYDFQTFIGYAKFRMDREEWDKAYYYLVFIFFDAFRDSENKEKNKFRNEIIDLMNICLEKMRAENK